MSTRACYTFKDEHGEFHVYKHHDGYPEGAASALSATLAAGKAWPLPRFEADEFGAAFIAANKDSGGGCRLSHGPDNHGDLEYRYVVRAIGNRLAVDVYERTFDEPPKDGERLLALTLEQLSECEL